MYGPLIDDVFGAVPPAYGLSTFGNAFKLQSRDACWVASLLASDSYMEGYSASRLWQYASCLQDQVLADSLRRHARDEAKHSRMFAASLFKVFPTLEDPALRSSLQSNSPEFDRIQVGPHLLDNPSPQELLNSMALINLHEIKALVLCRLMKPVTLAHAPAKNRPALNRLFANIENDEIHHISYSALYLERALETIGEAYIKELLVSFQHALNLATHNDLQDNNSVKSIMMEIKDG